MKDYLMRNWRIIIWSFIFGMLAVIVSLRKLSIIIIQRRIIMLKNEQLAITNLTKNLQVDYFKNKVISKQSYEAQLDKHGERMVRIKELLNEMKTKRRKTNGTAE